SPSTGCPAARRRRDTSSPAPAIRPPPPAGGPAGRTARSASARTCPAAGPARGPGRTPPAPPARREGQPDRGVAELDDEALPIGGQHLKRGGAAEECAHALPGVCLPEVEGVVTPGSGEEALAIG